MNGRRFNLEVLFRVMKQLCAVFFLLYIATLSHVQAQPGHVHTVRDTLGERLVTHHYPIFEKTFAFKVGEHNFTVKRKKIMDSLFYKTPDQKLHFFLLDTAEEEVYQGAPEIKRITIPIDSFYIDSLFNPAEGGQLLLIDTIKAISVKSRFVFEIPSVNDFFEEMKWLDEFGDLHPQYQMAVFKSSNKGLFNHLGNYTIHAGVAQLVSYLFKRQDEDWFILKLYRPDVHFEDPVIELVLHYKPGN